MLKDFFNLLFPGSCIACNDLLVKREELLCTYCRMRLPKTNYHLLIDNPLMDRFYGKIPVLDAFSYLKFIKGGITQRIMHQFKYEKNPKIGVMLGRWFAHDLLAAGKLAQVDLIIPVPLHPNKLRQRGYNQSDVFALALAEGTKIQFEDSLLIRRIDRGAQALISDKLSRWENVADNFFVTDVDYLKDKCVLLVDDVLTTGSTLEACAIPMLNCGIKSLQIATLAVAI